MRLGFRHGDRRYPFLWETADQPAARWHGEGEGPAHDLSDTPDGAWAEFLRHEGITDPVDLPGIERRIWAVEVPDDVDRAEPVGMARRTATGGLASYRACQARARALRGAGATALRAPSAALRAGRAGGQVVQDGLADAPDGDGEVWVLFGRRPDLRGWAAVDRGTPTERVLRAVRPL